MNNDEDEKVEFYYQGNGIYTTNIEGVIIHDIKESNRNKIINAFLDKYRQVVNLFKKSKEKYKR
jgi:hypothetical protein